MMNKKKLEIKLSKLKDYIDKSPGLEQYTTPSKVAASLLWTAYMNKDIEGKIIIDAGCGNGILGIGALILGAKRVIFVDVDERALIVTEENCKKLELKNYELLNSNIIDVETKADAVVMNPPFGVQTPLLDVMFLKTSVKLAKKVYLIYKGDGLKIIRKELLNKRIKVIKKTKLSLKSQYSYHTKPKQETKIILALIE